MNSNNVIGQVEIDGEYKSVVQTVPLTGNVNLMKLNNTLMQVETSPGVFKTVLAVANLASGGAAANAMKWVYPYVQALYPAYTTTIANTGIKDVEFETPAPVTITYYKDVDFFISNTEAKGLLSINDSWENVAQTDDFYGMDILIQEATISPDWDIEPVGSGNVGSVGLPDPARLNSYLLVASPYTTPALTAGEPTKLLVPTTVKTSNSFTLDIPNERYFFDSAGRENVEFSVESTMGLSSSSTNHTVDVELWKNGAREEGVGISRWIASGADLGAIGLTGTVILSDGDFIEFYITNSTGGTVTLSRLSININEKLGAKQ